jgi:hypothetical protein
MMKNIFVCLPPPSAFFHFHVGLSRFVLCSLSVYVPHPSHHMHVYAHFFCRFCENVCTALLAFTYANKKENILSLAHSGSVFAFNNADGKSFLPGEKNESEKVSEILHFVLSC